MNAPLTETEYHQHPALSQSGIKMLLPPGCPALYRYWMDNPRPSKPEYDLGHAAHKEILGKGQPIRYIQGKTAKGDPSDGWASKYAQEQKAEAVAAGDIPLLESQRGIIEGMVASVRAHPLASRLFTNGEPEARLFWTDEESGVPCRGMVDWLPNKRGGRMLLPDLKTAVSADPETFAKSAANYFYPSQAAFYEDGVRALGYSDDVAFLFVVVEKSAPYLMSVVQLDAEAIRIGRSLNRRAIQLYKQCTETNTWPGYAPITEVSLPIWWQRQNETEFAA